MDLQIYAITNPAESIVQPQALAVHAPVRYLELARNRGRAGILREHRYWLKNSPSRYISALRYTIRDRDFDSGYKADSRFACFMQAVYLAWLLQDQAVHTGRRTGHLHAHFAHDPAFIALLVHMLTGISYSFTAHARDLYQLSIPELIQRAEHASAVITCCSANVHYLDQVLPGAARAKVRLIRHGIDLQGFHGPSTSTETQTPLILSIGRLVEKKGFLDLLQACQLLQQAKVKFRCEIYGEGPLHPDLDAFIQQHGLAGQVTLAGVRTQGELVPIYQQASIFALTPSITEDGDRDGIPNVLVEAMACGLPVVSTAVGGIPELVRHQKNGLLFMPHDASSVAVGLADLLNDAGKRKYLGAEARRSVAEDYDIRTAAHQLATLFENRLQTATTGNGSR